MFSCALQISEVGTAADNRLIHPDQKQEGFDPDAFAGA